MNIIEAINDPNLFKPFLADGSGCIKSWSRWQAALKTLYGLPIPNLKERAFVRSVTKRKRYAAIDGGFGTGLFLTGRRSGKSRISSIIAAYEAAIVPIGDRLSRGEKGLVPIISPTKAQSRVIRSYCEAIFETPLLKAEVVRSTPTSIELRNGNRIEILAGDYKTIRGYTLLAAVVDEVAFFGMEESFSARSDTELMRAIKPALATTGGKLIAIGSPYGKRGWAYNTCKRFKGKSDPNNLIWNCPSRTMNRTLPQSVVDQALQEDYAAAKAEYLGEFRDDVAVFLPKKLIESVVVKDRVELLPRDHHYFAFVDVSGGRIDGSALAISHLGGEDKAIIDAVFHLDDDKAIIDAVFHWPSPHDPYKVIACMAEECRRFAIKKVTGDNYAGEFVARAFQGSGIAYEKSKLPKSQLYLELLPRFSSSKLQLLDNKLLIDQLANLERRTRPGGKDTIDHPHGGHDDLCNAVAGAAFLVTAPRRLAIGAF